MQGFAVIDFETTGLMPEMHDRVVEVGVVLVDAEGEPEDEWTTLINPQRDLGAAHIHGIQGHDLLAAPDFSDICDHLIGTVAGRVVVAHNAVFDMRFLHAELDRCDYPVSTRPDALCSMKWAGRVVGSAKLQHCCEALGIELTDAHQAIGDARATAALLRVLLRHAASDPEWAADVSRSVSYEWPVPLGSPAPSYKHRSTEPPAAGSWMAEVLASTWVPGSPENEAAYLLTLDAALLDREISASEGRILVHAARQAGLTAARVVELHHRHLDELAVEALADGVLTDTETADLNAVAAALGLSSSDVDAALESVRANGDVAKHVGGPAAFLRKGDRIVFTGEMQRDRGEWVDLIVAAGLASGGVTKSTRVLVTADPDSQSGKAAKARKYGVPVVGEDAFERLFNEYTSAR